MNEIHRVPGFIVFGTELHQEKKHPPGKLFLKRYPAVLLEPFLALVPEGPDQHVDKQSDQPKQVGRVFPAFHRFITLRGQAFRCFLPILLPCRGRAIFAN